MSRKLPILLVLFHSSVMTFIASPWGLDAFVIPKVNQQHYHWTTSTTQLAELLSRRHQGNVGERNLSWDSKDDHDDVTSPVTGKAEDDYFSTHAGENKRTRVRSALDMAVEDDDDDDQSYFSEEEDDDDVGDSTYFSQADRKSAIASDELTILHHRLGEQQKQIEELKQLVQSLRDTSSPLTIPNDATTTSASSLATTTSSEVASTITMTNLPPLRAKLFIDGTWLYYSLYEREAYRCPIAQRFGAAWYRTHRLDFQLLPRIICGALVDPGWSSLPSSNAKDERRVIEIQTVSVFTSIKPSTSSYSNRVKLFEEMKRANYDVFQLETVGHGEKCVDIQLAVEMMHAATDPHNPCDLAILLTGDKDFLPAMARTREKGTKVALVSMTSGCNKALLTAQRVRDFDTIWLEDYLDQLFVLRNSDGGASDSDQRPPTVSYLTVAKVIKDMINYCEYDEVCNRDIGSFLKSLEFGETNLLEAVRASYGNIAYVLSQLSDCFEVNFDKTLRAPTEKNFWIRMAEGADEALVQIAKNTNFTQEEKVFFRKSYSHLLANKNVVYEKTMRFKKVSTESPTKTHSTDDTPPPFQSSLTGASQEEVPHFSSLTVVELREMCRDRGLPTSGLKAALIERLSVHEKARAEERKRPHERVPQFARETASAEQRKRPREPLQQSSLGKNVSDSAEYYLLQITMEFIKANGGNCGARALGRYLQANRPSSGHRGRDDSALVELKNLYGGLLKFVSEYPDIFRTDEVDTPDSGYEFVVYLK